MKFGNLGADSKLAVCLGLLAAIAFSAVGVVAVVLSTIDLELERTLAASAADAGSVEKLCDRFEDVARLRRRLSLAADPDAKAAAIDALDVAARDAGALFDAAVRSAPLLAARVEQERESFTRFSHPRDGSVDPSGIEPEAARRSASTAPGDDPDGEMRKLRDDIEDAIRARFENGSAKAERARTLRVEALGAGLAVALGLTFLALRLGLNVPIQALALALRSFSPTSAGMPLPGLDRKDEAGQIARRFDAARTALSAEMTAAADRRARIDRGVAELRAAESQKAAEGRAQTLNQLGAAMKTLAGGDLTIRLGDSLSSDGAPVARHFDSALNVLTKAVVAFGMSADAVQSTVRDMSQASNELALRGEQQGRCIEQASSALGNIATRSDEAADGVAQMRRHATVVSEEATKSADRLKEAIELWDLVAKSAEQVSGITALVDEVSFQTKLLALNASVEAARAGDVGRGIAVVALELRALAQRATQAAREFDGVFSTSTARIRKGSALLNETGASFERIRQEVVAIETATSAIGVGASDQSKDVCEIRGALDRIGAASRLNAKTAADVSSGSRSVDELIDKLSELIQHYRLGVSAKTVSAAPRARANVS